MSRGRVQVLDRRGRPLSPCDMGRAEQLVAEGQATWEVHDPPTIRLAREIDIPAPEPQPVEPSLAGQSVLLHICCGPCATYSVERLRELQADVTGFWFNPNIHPFAEHERRRETCAQFAEAVALPMVWEPGYEMPTFLQAVCGQERFGERCAICYRLRLERTAQRAAEQGMDAFTTTLLISPYQNQSLIHALGQELGQRYDVPFYFENWRRGFRRHHELAEAYGLYRQRYCGCIYSEWEALDRGATTGARRHSDAPRG